MTIDTALLASLPNLRMRADIVVKGVLTGTHSSPYQGQSVEFAEHKEYSPGDDLRRLDWKVFGKSDRYYVRRFEQETEAPAVIALDASGSMAYGSGSLRKCDTAATFAAALAIILNRQQDPVSLAIFSGTGIRFIPPGTGPGHLINVIDALENASCEGKADIHALLARLSDCCRKKISVLFHLRLFRRRS